MKPRWLSMTRIRLVADRWTAIYRNRETLHSTEQVLFRSESPEFRNWIAAAGVSFNTVFWGAVIDYVPCYRSETATGAANSLN